MPPPAETPATSPLRNGWNVRWRAGWDITGLLASGGQRIDTRDASGAPSSMSYSLSQLDAIGDVDPVAEADVYLAYGRDLQAEEILREALRVNPDRTAIHLKLLEIHAKRRDPGLLRRRQHRVHVGDFGRRFAHVEHPRDVGAIPIHRPTEVEENEFTIGDDTHETSLPALQLFDL